MTRSANPSGLSAIVSRTSSGDSGGSFVASGITAQGAKWLAEHPGG